MFEDEFHISRRQALLGLGLAGGAAVAPAAWQPLSRLVDRPRAGDIIRPSAFSGSDADRIVKAFSAASAGSTIIFDPGQESVIDSLISIGNGGDVQTAPGVHVIANGHAFRYSADGARLELNGPISAIVDLASDYVVGSRSMLIAHRNGQLNDFIPGRWVKIVSDALDGWNRNRGGQHRQYRLAEFALIRSVANHGSSATLTLWEPLKFTRGFVTRGDPRQLVETNSYTTANNTRVVALLCDTFSWEGGSFYVEDAERHLGPQGWNTRSLLRVQGFTRPVIRNVSLGPGVGKGLEIQGCVDFTVSSPRVQNLPDFASRATKGPVKAGLLGYGISIGGCWRGRVDDLVARDCRHAVTEGSSAAAANSTTYGILMSSGRTFGTRINHPRVSGRFSAAIDTHHGSHGWVISNPRIDGGPGGFGISLRGPEHVVIAPLIKAQHGVQLFSEFDNDGGADLPGLVGKGNKWMSSARIVGGDIRCASDALSVRNAYLELQRGMNIWSQSAPVFTCDGGVLDLASGQFNVAIAEDRPSVKARLRQQDIVRTQSSHPSYGTTWSPGMLVRPGARLAILGR
jgi:hypothetical protein